MAKSANLVASKKGRVLLVRRRGDGLWIERTGGASFLTPLRSTFFIFKGLLVILVGMFKPRHAEVER